jgi:hypothetical protein
MLPDWIPDLPFDQYYKFIASIGTIILIPSLVIETTFLDNQVVFEMGAVALGYGFIGWFLEKFVMDYEAAINMKWRHAVSKASKVRESPYDIMDVNQIGMAWIIGIVRLLFFIVFISVELGIYAYR